MLSSERKIPRKAALSGKGICANKTCITKKWRR